LAELSAWGGGLWLWFLAELTPGRPPGGSVGPPMSPAGGEPAQAAGAGDPHRFHPARLARYRVAVAVSWG
jgi:hypothetical protein